MTMFILMEDGTYKSVEYDKKVPALDAAGIMSKHLYRGKEYKLPIKFIFIIEYYQMILEEQKSENGGILLAIEKECISGVFCYAKEMEYELREPICHTETVLKNCIYQVLVVIKLLLCMKLIKLLL